MANPVAKVKVGVKAEVKDDDRNRTYNNKLLDYEKGDRLTQPDPKIVRKQRGEMPHDLAAYPHHES